MSSTQSTLVGSTEEVFSHSQYAQGYFADTDVIREQEYPLLNGMA